MAEKKQFNLGQHVPRIVVRRQVSGGANTNTSLCSPGSPLLKVSFNGQTFDLPRDGSIHVKRSHPVQFHSGINPNMSTSTPHGSAVVQNLEDGSTRIHFEHQGKAVHVPVSRTDSGTKITAYQIPVLHRTGMPSSSDGKVPISVVQTSGEVTPVGEQHGCRDSGYSSAFADFEKMFEKFSDDSKQNYVTKVESPLNSPSTTHKKRPQTHNSSSGGRLFSDDLLEDETSMSQTEKLRVLKARLEKLKSQFSIQEDKVTEGVAEDSGYSKYQHDLDNDVEDNTNNGRACSDRQSPIRRKEARPLSTHFRKSKSEDNTMCSRLHDKSQAAASDLNWYRTAPPGGLYMHDISQKHVPNHHSEHSTEVGDLTIVQSPEDTTEPSNQVQFDSNKLAELQKKVERLKLDDQDLDEMFSNGWCDNILTARTRKELGLDTEKAPSESKPLLPTEDENSNTPTGFPNNPCLDCGYTCHHKCQKSVTLECSGGATSFPPEEETALHDPPDDHEHMSALHNDLCETDSGYSGSGGKGERTLTKEDLQRSIWQFNERFPNLGMTMPDSQNTFHGFVHVNMNLSRPINMRVSPRPPSIYDVLQHELSEEDFKTKILSFYLPKDTLKALHISSKTTAQEVIEVLLNKFKITDNPRKFALYEQTLEKNAEIRLRKILDSEHPLVLCLNWGNEMSGKKRFVLQENETGEIMWEAFSVPELQNFLKILELEENEVLKELKNKYIVQRKHMQEIMKEHEEKRQNKERT